VSFSLSLSFWIFLFWSYPFLNLKFFWLLYRFAFEFVFSKFLKIKNLTQFFFSTRVFTFRMKKLKKLTIIHKEIYNKIWLVMDTRVICTTGHGPFLNR
jgi:hypothetical protein